MIKTYGLTHIGLLVTDLQRTLQFYEQVLGVRVMYRHEHFIQVQTPGARDIIVFEVLKQSSYLSRPSVHFGFRLTEPANTDDLAALIVAAGGTIKEKGQFVPGEPYIFFYDPDGYEVEIWYEHLPENMEGFQ